MPQFFYKRFADRLRSSGCSECPLCEHRANIVVDRGNPAAELLLIGEAPGEEEDKSGRAFVGQAGKLLDSHLHLFGLSDADFLIVNLTKCRPQGNRKPHKKEIAACSRYLHRQIKLVHPKWIVLLGSTALESMMQSNRKVQVTFFAGKFLDPICFSERMRALFGGARVFVQFHPAAALHNPSLLPKMLDHWRTFFQAVREESA